MASRGPRPKAEHEARPKRQRALEVSREPRRPKTHWDHVLDEMVWLSKDFESERKWKLAQAKKVAIRASKGMLDQATRGEKKVKEEEQKLRKIALNISKDVKKFWTKIEKLVLYKHQLELEEKKKKALDRQLDFLLGQTERYSTMLAENLVDMPNPHKQMCLGSATEQHINQDEGDKDGRQINEDEYEKDEQTKHENEEGDQIISHVDEEGDQIISHGNEEGDRHTEVAVEGEPNDLMGLLDGPDEPSSDHMDVDGDYVVQLEDESEDEHTIEEDEALITREERKEELEGLQDEMDLPLEELLRRYKIGKVREGSPGGEDSAKLFKESVNLGEGKDAYISSTTDAGSSCAINHHLGETNGDISMDEHRSDSDIGIGENQDANKSEMQSTFSDCSDNQEEDGDYIHVASEEKDDETTLVEEEELAKDEAGDAVNEIELLQKESEIPIEELLARYKKDYNMEEDEDDAHGYTSDSSEDLVDLQACQDVEPKGASSPLNKDAPLEAQPYESKLIIAEQEEDESNIKSDNEKDSDDIIADAAAAARSAQPTGNTFLTTKVRTKFPFLLKHPLREYQHIGLDWLVTMYEKRLNGILADEMGLGKTIMTISLLAHLACEKGIWGPHLIVVPTSVMLNWETEFLKWCPAFKILTYFGSAKERKFKRQGWMKPNSFHVCITTYRLVIQDSKAFKRKKWKYLILDEAHLIKNWKSQRWQTLLNFNSKRRILLTGTPLQNDLMELWSLMHFLMPHIFQSHQEFKDWFSNPISGMVEGQEKVNKEVVDRLHNVLRPFLLRRLKRDVEKQLPGKHEHVIYCRLSKRQRNLYEDFIASSETQATLASSNFFGMISVIMQLRKVCNHPDLFEGRPIISSFDMSGIDMQLSSSICTMLSSSPFSEVNLKGLGLLFTDLDFSMTSWESDEIKAIATPSSMIEDRVTSVNVGKTGSRHRPYGYMRKGYGTNVFDEIQKTLWEERLKEAKERAKSIAWWNSLQCRKKPMYGTSLRDLVTVRHPVFDIHQQKSNPSCYLDFSSKLANIVLSPVERFQRLTKLIESFMFAIPAARASSPVCWCSKSGATVFSDISFKDKCTDVLAPLLSPIRPAIVRRQVYFPDRRLIQFDCGKLQQLAVLLRRLKSEGHRALIFTQMTKMLDVLEAFINLYGYTYMRLDGSTPPEERQTLMQRFNTNPKIFLFILSTRSGGVGINLVGADTVIFYDSDWNPAMDQQAQDRCHRIGQTREVHIYRLISESTIEENILKKANQKRVLDDLVIQSGSYNTEFFKKLDPLELFSGHRELPAKNMQKEKSSNNGVEVSLSNADVEAALKQAEDEADYMALKKVEQEEAVENQEFLDEAIGRVEDDELVNEDDAKFDEKAPEDQSTSIAALDNDVDALLNGSDPNDDRVLTLTGTEEDDMLADVKQLAAAAAAAGHASSSFENQLRPIDRYAMRFMDLWDPIIDKSALVSQVNFEEKEWELDRIEKFKEDLEAEIDDDEEPFLYEEWDADYATEAYRQQVEVLAQRQLLEDLECEAKEAEAAEKEKLESLRIEAAAAEIKSKPKKKTKKKKFKSLKKGALTSEVETTLEEPLEYLSIDDESMYADDLDSYSDFIPSQSPVQKKRKKAHTTQNAEEKTKRKSTKKQKKGPENSRVALEYSSLDKQHAGELVVLDLDHRPACRSRMGGKISITTMPVKRVLLIKPEKLNKKGSLWLRGCISLSDSWSSSEDAIICAIVHEYGTHWSLASDVIYGMPAGGFYRGRFRHPFQCCERFRDLFHKYVLSIVESPNIEKVTSTCSGKSILKVTEDGTRTLLNITSDLADSECILQKHFTAILSSVWRARSRFNHWSNLLTYQEGFGSARWFVNLKRSAREPPKNLGAIGQSSKLVAAALQDTYKKQHDDISQSEVRAAYVEEPLEIILEVQTYHEDCEKLLPSHINVLICGSDPPQTENESGKGDMHPDLRSNMAEHRFRGASKACFDGVTQGGSSSSFPAFPAFDLVKSRPTSSKPQSAGKPSKSKQLLRGASTELPREDEHHSPLTCKQTTQILAHKTASAASVGYLFGDSDNIRSCTGGADVGAEDRDVTGMDGYGFYEVDATLPYNYDPSFISGLDDCTLLQDITDIG